MAAEAVGGYREQYRRDHVPARYHAGRHLAFTFGAGGALLAAALLQLEAVRPLEWLALPLTLLYANLAEYWGHRGPMHHRVRGLQLVFERHTRQHHRFFAHDAMAIDGPRDLRAVLFPPLLVTFFITVFALPAGLLLAWLATPNVAWLFVATSVGYFLNYELLHMAYHLPAGHWLAGTRLIRWLKPLHQAHHDPHWMTRCNFNITYPLGDRLFGTLRRDERFRHRPSAA